MDSSGPGRLVGVLTSPTQTFRSIAERPTWLVALVVLVALSAAASFLATDKIDFEQLTRDQIEASGRTLSEDQLETTIELQEKWGRWISWASVVLGAPLAYLAIALVFWVLLKLLGGELPYKASFSTTLHSMMPWAVASVLTIPVVLGRDEIGFEDLRGGLLASNLAILAPEDAGAALTTLLSSIDLFSIWTLFLMILGFSITARVSKKASAGAVLGVWALYVLGKVGLAGLFG